jgi:hypothetical protein
MTSYTPNRGYPYPSSAREAGNGGLHSELLARAVARDLDTVDAGWAAELQHSTVTLQMTSDHAGYGANSDQGVFFDGLEHGSSGLGLFQFSGQQTLGVAKGGDGWYDVTGALRAISTGGVTGAARHIATLRKSRFLFGGEDIIDTWSVEAYQAGTAEISITVQAVMHLAFGEELALYYFHTNASGMTLRQAGTNLGATLIFRG